MNKICAWYNKFSKQKRDSITISVTVIGVISTILSILGISLGDIQGLNFCMSIMIVFIAFVIIYMFVYWAIDKAFKKYVNIIIRQTSVSVSCGDIFTVSGLRVICCDTHFDTRINDTVKSKK